VDEKRFQNRALRPLAAVVLGISLEDIMVMRFIIFRARNTI